MRRFRKIALRILIGFVLFLALAYIVIGYVNVESISEGKFRSTLPETIDTLHQENILSKLHAEVLVPGCTVSGCHDGHFEPDFRTLESTFYTLVYHPVIKNNEAGAFKYRVVPYDTAASVLYERITNCCFVNEDDRMPQLVIGEPLPDEEIRAIGNWIMAGAPDMLNRFPPKDPPIFAVQ